jgi:SAM-dependent methyltransferase
MTTPRDTGAGPLFRVLPDDPAYLKCAEDEAAFWGRSSAVGFEAREDETAASPLTRYSNRRLTGDPNVPWQDTIRSFGPFERGLFLGTSVLSIEARILETNPRLHATFLDLSEGALKRRLDALGPRFAGRIDTRVADLNFVDLPESAYDVIVSAGTLHHITNLEHLAAQANRALTDGGYLFFQDYAGETRFKFTDEKRRLFETIYNSHILKQSWRKPGVVWLDESDLSPFCGIRSADILPVFREHLDEQRVHTVGALTTLMLRSRPVDWLAVRPPLPQRLRAQARRRIRALLGRPAPPITIDSDLVHDLALVGDIASDAGVIAPGNAFGIYRKRI